MNLCKDFTKIDWNGKEHRLLKKHIYGLLLKGGKKLKTDENFFPNIETKLN